MKPPRWMILLAGASMGCTLGHTDVLAGSDGPTDGGAWDADSGGETSSFDGGFTLAGTWAQLLVYGTIFNLPAIGQTEGQTVTVIRVSIVDGDGAPRVSAKTCSVEIDNGTDVVETIIPDRFIASLVVQEPVAALASEGVGLGYSQDRVLTLRGVRLQDEPSEPLPTEATDPRVYDQDEDGRPGMTVLITGLTDGEVYVIQRDWYALSGQVVDKDRIDGLAQWRTEQVVLGSDNAILNMQTESSPHPDETRSYFRMVRVPDEHDCGMILAQREALFGAR